MKVRWGAPGGWGAGASGSRSSCESGGPVQPWEVSPRTSWRSSVIRSLSPWPPGAPLGPGRAGPRGVSAGLSGPSAGAWGLPLCQELSFLSFSQKRSKVCGSDGIKWGAESSSGLGRPLPKAGPAPRHGNRESRRRQHAEPLELGAMVELDA